MEGLRFDGDVIVVTGAGGGMGRCHALELASRGARVVVNDLGGHPFGGGSDPGLAEAVVEEIRAVGGEAVANVESVADVEGAASLTEQALDTWGRLDAVVANAAILRDKPFDEMTVEDFDDVIDVNLRGVMRVLHPAYKAMKASGGGRIVAVTSTSGFLGARAQTNYGAAKSGLLGLTRSLALEGQASGIKANLLAPGALGTRMHTAMVESATYHADASADLVQSEAAAAFLRPERVSPMVSVLTHPTCPVTGQVLGAWGGMFHRFGVTLNAGWTNPDGPTTAEDILANWDRIVDEESARDAGLDSFGGGRSS
ncbi:SDR family NAD(P)-dependent oxidoreductase [Dermatobacter hominis]|uniref:SDR family NAD(P)-dependent oxidoreductase n=1 Tax=Dermatobacter hominis TaxID=2884263 RepID=UPI001D123C28|nr:SDR family NAD(P)-dependent oxidoreductase [Dermatobacter hominis]UDY37651.1 SDR family NAD(P)-dependent oxidoreductase [Dermatobacter hominis]